MIKKIISCLVALAVLLYTFPAAANDLTGKVTSLDYDEQAPYAGVLLDPIAASKMLVDQKYLKIETELTLRKEFQKDLAEKRLAYDLLDVQYKSLKQIHEETLSLKNKQIADLNVLLKEEMSDDNQAWWVLGGAATGIILSIAVFYASVEIVK